MPAVVSTRVIRPGRPGIRSSLRGTTTMVRCGVTDKRVVIRVLGPVDVVACGRSQEPSLLERNLLAVLASRMGGTVPTERLTDVLWTTEPPRSARNRIQALVSSLRRRLATAPPPPPPPPPP